jgi:hypothetical protein
VLEFDPFHLAAINFLNLVGLIIGVFISCIYTLVRKDIRFIWIVGFTFLLIFHVCMFFLFNPEINSGYFYIPLFLQGLGVGFLMVPIILFAISSVPKSMGVSASALALFARFFGFCANIAIINYLELYSKSKHFNTFQTNLSKTNPLVKQTLGKLKHNLLSRNLNVNNANKGAHKILVDHVNEQNHLRFGMDYYEWMAWTLVFTLLLIALFPRLNRTVIYLKSKLLTPA